MITTGFAAVSLLFCLIPLQAMGQGNIGSESITSMSTTPTASEQAPEATHTINVGASGHKMSPDNITAKIGDILEYRFYPGSHWVIRGDFDYPCIPYEYVGLDRQGFSSGTQTVQAITDDGPRFRVRVNDTLPIFYYCGAPDSCVGWHMMGVVNPNVTHTLDIWREKAEDVDFQLRPGDPWPKEGDIPSPTASSQPENKQAASDEDSDLGGGAIAGIVIGAIAVVVIAALAFFWWRRRPANQGRNEHVNQAQQRQMSHSFPPTVGIAPSWSPPLSYPDHNGPQHLGMQSYSPPLHSQSISPPHISPFAYHPVLSSTTPHEGTLHSYMDMRHYAGNYTHPSTEQKAPEQNPAVELPSSADPGNSPLPEYPDSDRAKTFSWSGAENLDRSTSKY